MAQPENTPQGLHAVVDPVLLAQSLTIYDLEPATARYLGGFESHVFEARRRGQAFILKLGDPEHRSRDAVQAECEWLEYLAASGLPVAPAIRTQAHEYAALLGRPGQSVCARAYVKAPGTLPSLHDMTPRLAATWGRLMGRLHDATKRYSPPSPRRRHRWYEDADFARARAFLPTHEHDSIGGRLERLVGELHGLPTDAEAFGLVHTDAHFGNVLHHRGELTLIDFDDCAYEWFASDIAIVLFYVAIDPLGRTRQSELQRMFRNEFLSGYARENSLAPSWLKELDRFMKLRELVLYTAIRRVSVRKPPDAWARAYIGRHGPRILADLPVWPEAGR